MIKKIINTPTGTKMVTLKPSKPTQKDIKLFTYISSRYLGDWEDTVKKLVVRSYYKKDSATVLAYGHTGINYCIQLYSYKGEWEVDYAEIF